MKCNNSKNLKQAIIFDSIDKTDFTEQSGESGFYCYLVIN